MNRPDSVRPVSPDALPASIVEIENGEHQWRVARPHAGLLESGGVDWFHLQPCAAVELVKRNTQRDVWHVRFNGREYFAKLYHPNGALARAKLLFRGATALREWDVGLYAAAHSISTVVPVATAWTGARGNSGPSLLITEAVKDSEPLNEYWLRIRNDRVAAEELTHLLARLIARAHQCGFQHGDMHPGNILIRPNGRCRGAFFVDLHKVRTGRPVGRQAVVANLAQLNQWFRRNATRTQLRRFLECYLAYRDRYAQASALARDGRIEPAALIADLTVQADRHARRLWDKRDRRARRTGKYFARIRPAPRWRGHVLLRSKHPCPTACAARLTFTRRQWENWLRDPPSWVDPNRHELLKDSHTATVCLAILPTDPRTALCAGGETSKARRHDTSPGPPWKAAVPKVIVKRPLPRSLWKRLVNTLGRSRNRRSWLTANMLLNRDLPAAQPLAVVERYAAGLIRLDSIGITDFVPDAADLETFLTRDVARLPLGAQRKVKDRLIEAVVALLKAFHARGFVHRDLKAPNLLVSWKLPRRGQGRLRSTDDGPRLTFIDMDGIRRVGRSTARQRNRAVARLCASLLGSPACTRADRLRFLKRSLTGPGRVPSDWKDHWRAIQQQVRTKILTQEARRQWKLDRYGRE